MWPWASYCVCSVPQFLCVLNRDDKVPIAYGHVEVKWVIILEEYQMDSDHFIISTGTFIMWSFF